MYCTCKGPAAAGSMTSRRDLKKTTVAHGPRTKESDPLDKWGVKWGRTW